MTLICNKTQGLDARVDGSGLFIQVLETKQN